MDWVQIAIVVIVVSGACFAVFVQKAGRPKPYDPSALSTLETPKVCKPIRPWAEDPIAKSIEWTERASTKGGGGVGHKLRYVGSSRIEFQPVHPRSWYIITLLAAIGAAVFVYFEKGSIGQCFLVLLCGMGLSAVGWLFFHFSMTPVVFDKSSGIFWAGRKQPEQISGNPLSKCVGRIYDIYAIQLILTYFLTRLPQDPDCRTYPEYQINLVMKNGTRINVVNYGSFNGRVIKNAKALSTFLGKPLWDAC